ncbi:MAG: chromosome segregation protein SMC [Promethearchaeota archaeon]
MVHIKSLKLRGFKSVGATRTVTIEFDRGFSAIVGANGSGKSNILEAFSFVMGNGSAKSLRAGNMKSMIFSGNKKKGISPAKEAWVQMVFDNSDRGMPIDSDIVTISRKVKLNGSGTYKINGQGTTRQAIRDLLNMTGLDSNSYNMVLQGNVYEVVNMTKIERRKLIEKISGIAAYDEKKLQAQRELEKVEGNMSQIRLLMNEVSTQLASLEREKDDALKYQSITKKLDHSQNALKIVEIEELEQTSKLIKDSITKINEKITLLATTITSKQEELYVVKDSLSKTNDELHRKQSTELLELNERLDEFKQELSDIKSQLKYLKQTKQSSEKESKHLLEATKALEHEKGELEIEIAELRGKSRGNKTQRESLQANYDEKISELAAHDKKFQDLVDQKESFRASLIDAKHRLSETRSELKMVNTYLGSERKALEKSEKQLVSLTRNVAELSNELSRLRGNLAQDDARLPDPPEKVQRLIRSMESELRITKSILQEKSQQLFEIRSTIKIAKNFSRGGVQRAIDGLMEAKREGIIDGIYDTVANLGKVDTKYAVAMEIAAGSRINFMVVRDRRVASDCIRYLKQKRLGRLSFIPLDKIHYSEYHHDQKFIDGVYGRAVDLIDFRVEFLPAFEFIFGRTFIVDNLEIAKKFAQKYRRITLDGDVVDASNLMTGGSRKNKNAGNSFGNRDAARIPALEQEIESLKRKERDADRKIRELQESISDYYTTKINLEKERGALRERIAKIETKVEEALNNKRTVQKRIKELKESIDARVSEKERLLDVSCKQEFVVKDIEGKIHSIDDALSNSPHAKLKEEIDAIEKLIRTAEANGTKLEIKLAQISTRLEEHVNGTIKNNHEHLSRLKAEIESMRGEINQNQQQEAEMKESIKDLETLISSKNGELNELVEKRDHLASEKERLNLSIQRHQMEKRAQDQKALELESQGRTIRGQLAELREALPESMNVPEEYVNKSRVDLSRDIDKFKRQIESMGNVNMMAIEKYNENKERFENLTSRHGILINERESILEFMENIEKQKKTTFMQAYQNIARNFTYIFSQLSPGGEAKLELENLEDPFAGGVLIMARPAGKPLNEISLLSGGEKSLTSLSLIFAIQQHCPSPLYILDEIDAALDDANAGRVATLIKNLSDRSQFIIVTHRDVTMTKVDQILGVSNVDGCTDVINLNLSQLSEMLIEG